MQNRPTLKYRETSLSHRLSIIIALLSCGWWLTACHKAPQEHQAEALPIEVAHPIVKSVLLTKDYPGYLKADKTIQLVARVSGTLTHNLYKAGGKVHEGEKLFVIDPRTYRQQVAEAKAAWENAQAALKYAQATYQRTEQAAQSDAVAKIQVIQTKANYEQALAEVKKAEAALKLAEIALGYCTISAPFSGHISLSSYDVGNYLNANEQPILATLYKDDTLYAYFNVSENQYLMRETTQGNVDSMLQDLIISLPALGDKEKGQLEYVSPNITLSTGTLQLRALIRNLSGKLRDGMYTIVSLPYRLQEDAILVPDASIGHDQAGSFLYVIDKQDQVRVTHITTGQLIDDTLRVITQGLKPEDRYVTRAQLKVRAGMKITPIMQK